METVSTGKLTKTFFMSLQEAAYLVSNVCNATKAPLYAAAVASTCDRDTQWQDIKNSNVAGRLCYVFRDELEYKASQAILEKKYRISEDIRVKQKLSLLESLLEDDPSDGNNGRPGV